MVKARKFVVVKNFDGMPKESDFKLVTEELPPLKDGEYLVKSEFISVDPYHLLHSGDFTPPYDQFGFVVGTVTESKSKKFAVGSRVVGHAGYKDYWIGHDDKLGVLNAPTIRAPELGSLSPSHAVGSVGMPGGTAYFGLLEYGKPQAGETVVVTGAAGAVGHIVGQIAKIKGCRVVGFAGSDDKCRMLEQKLGFDVAINYKSADIASQLQKAAPGGVDVYYDNVGGELSSTIMSQMNKEGRVVVVGIISAYTETTLPKASILQYSILLKRLTVRGFVIWDHYHRIQEAFDDLTAWVFEGKIKFLEHLTEGFENIPKAFIGMLKGQNTGKAVVKV